MEMKGIDHLIEWLNEYKRQYNRYPTPIEIENAIYRVKKVYND
jgi:hypothetical protein